MTQVHRIMLTKRMIEDQETTRNIATISPLQDTGEDRHLRHPQIPSDIGERSIINVIEIIEGIKVPIGAKSVQDLVHPNRRNQSIEEDQGPNLLQRTEDEGGQERLIKIENDLIHRLID